MSPLALPRALFALRATLAIFFAVWAVEKFVKPDTTAKIWEHFYFVGGVPAEMSYLIGAVQLCAVVLFALGLFKVWTYGFFLLIHGLGTLTTWKVLIAPYEGGNHLFIAAIPVLGALLALFLLRREDTWLTLSRG